MKKILAPIVTLILALSLSLLPAAPASADTAKWGWSDNHTLGRSYVNRGDLVMMWQTIMWAENRIPLDYIDGQFGVNTEWSTYLFTGSTTVNSTVWSAVETRLQLIDDRCIYGYETWQYRGSVSWFNLHMKCSTGVWTWQSPNGTWRTTNHW